MSLCKYSNTFIKYCKIKFQISKIHFKLYYRSMIKILLNKKTILLIDNHLNWKVQVNYTAKKGKTKYWKYIKNMESCEHRYLVEHVVYSLIYSVLTYGLIAWGNTNPSTTEHLFILQKKTLQLMTLSAYREHTNPLFIKLTPRLLRLY